MENNIDIIREILLENGMDIANDGEKLDKLARLADELIRVNSFMNLTAIKDPAGIACKHFADSLTIVPEIPQNAHLLDVGSGAGFPALPVAIARPDVRVNSLDSTAKKVNYIGETARLLELRNVGAICGRAEELGANERFREKYDIVTARALARLNVLCELCMPFVKVDGTFLSMKSREADDELAEASRAIKKLGGEVADVKKITLFERGESSERTLISIRKIAPTPEEFPRNYSIMSKHPL